MSHGKRALIFFSSRLVRPWKKNKQKKKNAWLQVKLGTETLAGRDVQVVQRPSSTDFPANGPQLSKSFILEDFAFR